MVLMSAPICVPARPEKVEPFHGDLLHKSLYSGSVIVLLESHPLLCLLSAGGSNTVTRKSDSSANI